MTGEQHLLIFKVWVKDQGHTVGIIDNPCEQDRQPLQLGLSDLVLLLFMTRGKCFSGSGANIKVTHWTLLLNLIKQDKDRIVRVTNVKLGSHTFYDKSTAPITF